MSYRARVAKSEVLLDVDANARQAIAIAPTLVWNGPTPRLIDEWQIAPSLWNHIRHIVDDRGPPGQSILTSSAVPADDVMRHTGAGRWTRLRMRPMSLFETGHSSGAAISQTVRRKRYVPCAITARKSDAWMWVASMTAHAIR